MGHRTDLTFLRRVSSPAAIVFGLFLLVSTPRYHSILTPGARAYVLTAFALFFAGLVALAFSAMDSASAFRYRWVPRASGLAALALSLGASTQEIRSPLPLWILIGLAAALVIGSWSYPAPAPPRR